MFSAVEKTPTSRLSALSVIIINTLEYEKNTRNGFEKKRVDKNSIGLDLVTQLKITARLGLRASMKTDCLEQGCPTFFHNGPNCKFSYSGRTAKSSSL